MTIVHILHHGFPLCDSAAINGGMRPGDWPDGHRWVRLADAHQATCQACLDRTCPEPRQVEPMAQHGFDVLALAESICRIADQIHQAHHASAVGWQDCKIGVCASMEYVLAEVGLDKNLQRVTRIRGVKA